MKDREKLLNKLLNDFLNQDISVILEGAITTDFIIEKAKIVMSIKTLMITDTNNKELLICLDDVLDIKIHNCIIFELETQKLKIDC